MSCLAKYKSPCLDLILIISSSAIKPLQFGFVGIHGFIGLGEGGIYTCTLFSGVKSIAIRKRDLTSAVLINGI
jgi:hypothetical protein